MTTGQFWRHMETVCKEFQASQTSGHRTEKRNKQVGGADLSQHLGYVAVDIVLDDWDRKGDCIITLKNAGLFVLDEVEKKGHLHVDDRWRTRIRGLR